MIKTPHLAKEEYQKPLADLAGAMPDLLCESDWDNELVSDEEWTI